MVGFAPVTDSGHGDFLLYREFVSEAENATDVVRHVTNTIKYCILQPSHSLLACAQKNILAVAYALNGGFTLLPRISKYTRFSSVGGFICRDLYSKNV